ncbi:MAG: helix-turn-helix transcriptional regulator [Eubacteriales bacterium]|nr:helix-turn-helix transcriptional regulator [Eubacteriales bacterium]
MADMYNNLWKLLIDKKLKRTNLVSGAGISTSALAKMGKNQYVSLEVINKICQYLNVDIKDIVTLR